MIFREERTCKRCHTKIIYTNEVELNLWESRPGCPACTKSRKPGDKDAEGEAPEPTGHESIASLAEWMKAEQEAVAFMLSQGTITLDEAAELYNEIRSATRIAMELESL